MGEYSRAFLAEATVKSFIDTIGAASGFDHLPSPVASQFPKF
jgi:hypothetical protein